jgi:N-dimethylarginine dimethylaminohydrolase
MPNRRTIHGIGLMESGSFVWPNPQTAVTGRSARVNEEGTRQVEEVLAAQGVELLRVDLTGYRLHIDGAVNSLVAAASIVRPRR